MRLIAQILHYFKGPQGAAKHDGAPRPRNRHDVERRTPTMFLMSLPLLCAIIGALIYALAANPKAAEMGRLLFACGVLATLLAIGMSHPIKF